MASPDAETALLRWRLVLGRTESATSELWADAEAAVGQTADLAGLDRALDFLFRDERSRGLGASPPHVSTRLGDIRPHFPREGVGFLGKGALERACPMCPPGWATFAATSRARSWPSWRRTPSSGAA